MVLESLNFTDRGESCSLVWNPARASFIFSREKALKGGYERTDITGNIGSMFFAIANLTENVRLTAALCGWASLKLAGK